MATNEGYTASKDDKKSKEQPKEKGEVIATSSLTL